MLQSFKSAMLQVHVVEGKPNLSNWIKVCSSGAFGIIFIKCLNNCSFFWKNCGDISGNEIFKQIRLVCAKTSFDDGKTFEFTRGCLRKCPGDRNYLEKPERFCDNHNDTQNHHRHFCDTDLCNKSSSTSISFYVIVIFVLIIFTLWIFKIFIYEASKIYIFWIFFYQLQKLPQRYSKHFLVGFFSAFKQSKFV